MKRALLALLLLVGVPLSGCAAMFPAQQAAEQVEQVSKPRQYTQTLAKALLEVKDGLAAEFTAGRMQRAEFLATEAPVQRATAALDAAAKYLTEAATTKSLALTAVENSKRLTYEGQAALYEGLAIRKAQEAEAELTALRSTYNRVRGIN